MPLLHLDWSKLPGHVSQCMAFGHLDSWLVPGVNTEFVCFSIVNCYTDFLPKPILRILFGAPYP